MALLPQEQELIVKLANDMRSQELSTMVIDNDANELIQKEIGNLPNVTYRLVQIALLQKLGLDQAQRDIKMLQERVRALEAQGAGRKSSFLGGLGEKLFGQSGANQPNANYNNAAYQANPQPNAAPNMGANPAYAQQQQQQQAPAGNFAQSSFLGSALTTAAGVAGGMFLFQGISGMFGHGSAFGGGAGGTHDSVVNNYYGDSATSADSSSSSPQLG